MLQRTLKMLAVAALAIGAVLASNASATASSTTDAPSMAKTRYGCPAGYVCIYPKGQSYTKSNPDQMFWSYGHHNLTGRYGNHYVMNNQWVEQGYDAYAFLNSGYNGSGKVLHWIGDGGQISGVNLTPVNSITLNP